MLGLVAQLACQMSPGVIIEQLLHLLTLGQGQATVEVAITLEGCREKGMSVPNPEPSLLPCSLTLSPRSFRAPSGLGQDPRRTKARSSKSRVRGRGRAKMRS